MTITAPSQNNIQFGSAVENTSRTDAKRYPINSRLWKSKRSKRRNTVERLNQFRLWTKEKDNAQQQKFSKLRVERERTRKKKRKQTGWFRWLYLPTAVCWLLGIYITVTSTVQSLGEGTLFWTMRETFRIIGPVILGIGLVLLMVTEGLIGIHEFETNRMKSDFMKTVVNIDTNNDEKKLLQTTSSS
ncbi:unnamed protein product [Mytilus coruscus]|uniref:Uncharacterized protein n=1 Tax=Mytilus coruscus TaxID=42192 RepID=A0A6J8EHQ2_MYTCO|nr:unnamed protein product [Mytilus coruscus]